MIKFSLQNGYSFVMMETFNLLMPLKNYDSLDMSLLGEQYLKTSTLTEDKTLWYQKTILNGQLINSKKILEGFLYKMKMERLIISRKRLE